MVRAKTVKETETLNPSASLITGLIPFEQLWQSEWHLENSSLKAEERVSPSRKIMVE